ncbi:MAG: RNA-binding protein [Methylothermaceae bacteria B42]|nr:MAG: RNA-binding protein [Methylothermaceae bacteria B42]HHJ39817.1 ribosome assembly RNA-binding protein YhbY [Methylothermaceae bacterium]
MSLTPKGKRALRAKAHNLKPVVITGQAGITEAVLAEIDNALSYQELLKVRVNAEDRQARKEMVDLICRRLEAELVQILGHVATLYRENPD